MKKDLHRCPKCKRAVDYIKEIADGYKPRTVAVHADPKYKNASVKNLISPSTERRARRELGMQCGVNDEANQAPKGKE